MNKQDVDRIRKIWELPWEERRLILQDQRDAWGEPRFSTALWNFFTKESQK